MRYWNSRFFDFVLVFILICVAFTIKIQEEENVLIAFRNLAGYCHNGKQTGLYTHFEPASLKCVLSFTTGNYFVWTICICFSTYNYSCVPNFFIIITCYTIDDVYYDLARFTLHFFIHLALLTAGWLWR